MKFYHATTKEAAASIQKDGVLKAGPFGEVFLCRSPLDACKFLIIRGVLQVSVFEVNLKRSEVTESHDHSEGFFQCKAYTHGRATLPFQIGCLFAPMTFKIL